MKRILWLLFSRLYAAPAWLGERRKRFNRYMKDHYSPRSGALLMTAVAFVLSALMLFTLPYLGVANDGTIDAVMQDAGLRYLTDAHSNDYFVRVYANEYADAASFSLHTALIRLAKAVDHLFTQDTLFDVRFLAALYLLLFLPALYLTIKAALERLHYFSETAVIALFGLLIFADSSYIVYFNSLYPEPLLYIGTLYVVGGGMSLQRESRWNRLYAVLMLLGGFTLCATRRHCFIAGLVLAMLCILLMRLHKDFRMRVVLAAGAGIMTVCTLMSLNLLGDEFTTTSKIHAMTRGVLLQSDDPEKTLEEMNIGGSYAMLTDVSLYDPYPMVYEENALLAEDFLSRYTLADIGLHYLRHPSAMVAMLNLAVESSFDLRRSYCGNYEESVGWPARAQSTFWSSYSIYKVRSAPKTIGYLALLIIAYVALSGRKIFRGKAIPERFHYVYVSVMAAITLIGVGSMAYVILRSGDAQLTQYNLLLGLCMDILTYFVLTEILYKLNILETDRTGGGHP